VADEVDATFEEEDVVEVDQERDGECIMGSGMSARDDGEVVDMVFVKRQFNLKYRVARTPPSKLF
jgi:hypothetical protein